MPRAITVAVAITHDKEGRFFVSYNDRWRAYTFPMHEPRPGEKLEDVAVQAFVDHVPATSPHVVQPLAIVAAYGPSLGTGEPTYYRYHVYEVGLGQPLPLVDPAGAYHFLSLEDLLASPDVSWSAKEIAGALADPSFEQESAVAIVCRRVPGARQFLLVQNAGYGAFFFPAGRPRFEEPPEKAAQRAFRDDTDYVGPVEVARKAEAELRQFSQRYQVHQNYRFQLCKVDVPGVDLRKSGNALEAALSRYGIGWYWFSEEQLANPAGNGLTATVADLLPHVLAMAGECE